MGSGLNFGNPIVGGDTLVRARIKSPNYTPGVDGWTINRDGSAEFNNVLIRGELDVGDSTHNRDIKIGNDIPPDIQTFSISWFGTFDMSAAIVYYLGNTSEYYFQGIAELTTDTDTLSVYLEGYTHFEQSILTVNVTKIVTLNSIFGMTIDAAPELLTLRGGNNADVGWLADDTVSMKQLLINSGYQSQNRNTGYKEVVRYVDYDTSGFVTQIVDIGTPTYKAGGQLGGGVAATASTYTMYSGTTADILTLPQGYLLSFSCQPAPGRIYRAEGFFSVLTDTANSEILIEVHYGPLGTAADPVVASTMNVIMTNTFAKPAIMNSTFYIENSPNNVDQWFTWTARRSHGSGTVTVNSYRNYPSWARIVDEGPAIGPQWIFPPNDGSGW